MEFKKPEADADKISLATFLLSVSSAAFFALGYRDNGVFEVSEVNLELACHNIELLELMQIKTEGNRTEEENQLLEKLLFEVRMKFVEIKGLVESNSQ